MQKVRVGLAMVLAAGLMLVSGTRAHAVFGIPDDVPGSTLLFPFFKVDPTPDAASRQDSLIVITNTANPPAAFSAAGLASNTPHTWVHITIWNVRSEHAYDFSVQLTPHDVFSCSLLDLLVNPTALASPCGGFQAPTGVISRLTVDDILQGYVTVDVVSGPTSSFPGEAGYPFLDWNILIGHMYLVDLLSGSATGFNAVSVESFDPDIGHDVDTESDSQLGFYLNRCLESQGGGAATPCAPFGSYEFRERFDGPAGWETQTDNGFDLGFDWVGIPSDGDRPLSLILRYFSSTDLDGRTEVWLWKDRTTSGAGSTVTVAVYDEEENAHSISFELPDEVNFAETAEIISPGAPGGWFRIRFTCGPFGYCGFDSTDPAGTAPNAPWVGTGGTLQTPIQAVAYSLQFANSQDATLRWDAAFPAHRQYTDYIGGPSAE